MTSVSSLPLLIRDVVPNDADALAHILITAEEHTFRGLVPDACLQSTEAESAANWKRSLTRGLDAGQFFSVIQSEDGTVVGYAWGVPRDGDALYGAELKQIMILPTVQRQGIGRRLVRYIAARFTERGVHSLRVEVLRENPNRAFHEHLGARYVGQRPYDWDGFATQMIVYGWKDTSILLEGH